MAGADPKAPPQKKWRIQIQYQEPKSSTECLLPLYKNKGLKYMYIYSLILLALYLFAIEEIRQKLPIMGCEK